MVSRITGSVGKGLAAITMDKEYQQKRREEMGRQPRDFSDSLAKGGKGFLRVWIGNWVYDASALNIYFHVHNFYNVVGGLNVLTIIG